MSNEDKCGMDKLLTGTVQDRISQMILEAAEPEYMKKIAQVELSALVGKTDRWGNKERSTVMARANELIVKEIMTEVETMMTSDEYRAKMKQMAVDILDEVQVKVKEMAINNITYRLCGYVSDPNGVPNQAQWAIRNIVNEMLQGR